MKSLFRVLGVVGLIILCQSNFRSQQVGVVRQPKVELVVQTGHTSGVSSVAFSPDGRILASAGSWDGTIKLWDVVSGKELHTLSGRLAQGASVVFSPDGKTVARGGFELKLWDVETGKELRTLSGYFGDVVKFSPNGKTLASTTGKTISLWEIATGKLLRKFVGHFGGVEAVAFSPEGKTLASAGNDSIIKVWDVITGKELFSLKGHSFEVKSVAFSPNGRILASGSRDETIKLWSVDTRAEVRTLNGHSSGVFSVEFSPDGSMLASGSTDKTIKLWQIETGTAIRSLASSYSVDAITFSPDGRVLASCGGHDDHAISTWDVQTGRKLGSFTSHVSEVTWTRLGSNGRWLLTQGEGNQIKIWDLASGPSLRTKMQRTQGIFFGPNGDIQASVGDDKTIKLLDLGGGSELQTFSTFGTSGTFSPDGKLYSSANFTEPIKLWDVDSGRLLRSFQSLGNSVAFSPNGKILANSDGFNTINVWNVETGTLYWSRKSTAGVASVGFSQDGLTLASEYTNRTINIWDASRGELRKTLQKDDSRDKSHLMENFPGFYQDVYNEGLSDRLIARHTQNGKISLINRQTSSEICSLVALDENDWVVTMPDGRFDTNKDLSNINGLHWVVSDDPLTPVPLEIFLRDYYEPRLLPRLLKCTEEGNCDKEFPAIPNIAELNRVQPEVKISNVVPPDANGKAVVTVEVVGGKVPAADCKMKRCETGAFDLRIFRDGQLVGSLPADSQDKLVAQEQAVAGQAIGPNDFAQSKQAWRTASVVPLQTKPGKRTVTFEVQLPRNEKLTEVEFTAYAFNEDRVKSKTSSWRWTADQVAKMPAPAPVKPRAYVISVGVNAYENASFNLSYAANDARRFQEELTGRLKATGQYSEVVPVALISDWERRGGQTTQRGATKANFKAVLDRLSGKTAGAPAGTLADIPNAEILRKATPDDVVLILFSSHGFADKNGQFYFIPYDTGPGACKVFTSTVRQHSISSDELSLWMRDVDAGQMAMIIDACQSSAAVEGADFKPGPMGSRGLGQLAYDKSMMILTATQADNIATENPTLEQGVLSYALLQNGLRSGQADFKPKDQAITLKEWFTFAQNDVPKLFARINALKPGKNVGASSLWVVRELDVTGGGCTTASTLDSGELRIPEPGLFDFSRKRNDVRLTVGQ